MKKAFTIIELVIVISVLAILIALAIPKLKGMKDNGNMVKASKEVTTLMAAIENYRTLDPSHNYPPSTTTLQQTYLMNTSPALIKTIIYDPFGTTPTTEYNYLCSTNGQYFVVWSVGLPGQSQPTAISSNGKISY